MTSSTTAGQSKPDADRLRRRAVRSGAVLLAARLVVQVLLWGVTLVVARLLTPRDYGIMSVGVVFICLADLLAEAGVGRALVQKEDLEQTDLDAAFTLNVFLAVTLYALLLATADFSASFMKMPDLRVMLPVLGLMVLLAPLKSVAYALLDRDLRLERQAAIHVAFSSLQSVVVLSMAVLGFGFWSLVVGAVLGRLFEVVGLYLATRWRPRLMWTPWRHGALVRFGLNVSFTSLLLFFYNNSIFLIVGKLVGDVTLGYFSLAFQIISLPTQKLTVGTNQVAYPVFCRMRNDPVTLRDWYLRLSVFLGFLGIPILLGMALVAPEAFRLVLGEKWMPAVVPFRLLALVGVLMVYAASLPPLLDALGRPDLNLRYSALCAVLFPLGTYLGAVGFPRLASALEPAISGSNLASSLDASLSGPHGQLVGVCLAWLLLYPLILTGLVALTRSVTGIGVLDLARPQAPVALAAAAMVLAVYFVRQWVPALLPESPGIGAESVTLQKEEYGRLVLRLAVSAVTGAAVYAGVILLAARDTILADLRTMIREVRSQKTPAPVPPPTPEEELWRLARQAQGEEPEGVPSVARVAWVQPCDGEAPRG